MKDHASELNEIWHILIKRVDFTELESRFPRLKGLTTWEIGVISLLSRQPDIMMKDISERLNITKSTLTNIIDRLETAGYLKRSINPRDRRSFSLELADEGVMLQREHEQYESYFCRQIMESLGTEKEKMDFLFLAKKIVTRLDIN